VELDSPAAWIMEVRDGQIAYWETYTDAARAEREIERDP
jgi:ketosteroid isomerase-like protein